MTTPQRAIGSRYRVQRETRGSLVAAIVGLALLIAFATLPAWGSAGQMRLLVEFLTLLAMAQTWNLLAGYAGLVSIGQQAFVGVGAYGLFVAMDMWALHPVPAIALIAVAATVVAAFTSLFVFRLRGGYFAIGTWVMAEVLRLIVMQVPALGSGTGVTIKSLVGMPPADRIAITYWLALAVGFGSVVLAAIVVRSRLGLALRAVRDSEVSAASLGVSVRTTKRIVYVVASAGCAVAAAVYYLQLLRIQPTAAFSVDWTVVMIFIVVIGGLGRIEGPIVGAIVYVALQELLADYGSSYLIALGVFTMLIVLLAPHGLWGLITSRRPMALVAVERRLRGVDPPSVEVAEAS